MTSVVSLRTTVACRVLRDDHRCLEEIAAQVAIKMLLRSGSHSKRWSAKALPIGIPGNEARLAARIRGRSPDLAGSGFGNSKFGMINEPRGSVA